MEIDDVHSSKRSRLRNGGEVAPQEQRKDEEEEDGDGQSAAGVPRELLRPWQQHSAASRIYRVARSSGGKDRHSKVMTAKGLRDRRVRLSVSTAIQFYDLQDRLGYDQPSKAIEWLIKAAAAAISELPSLDGVFSDQPPPGRHLEPAEEKPVRAVANEEDDDDEGANASQIQFAGHHLRRHTPEQHFSLTRSTCSSTSETSKGSVLSLSRSEPHVKAKEKDKKTEADAHMTSAGRHHGLDTGAATPQSSFTELLTGHQTTADYHFRKQLRHPQSADYFQPVVFSTQSGWSTSSPHLSVVPFNVAAASAAGDHPEMQPHFMEHLVPYAVTAAGGDLINFSISSGVSGLNRGTLQSNSPSPALHQHLQRFSSPADGSNLPLFLGGGATAVQSTSPAGEAQLPPGFDSRLQLCYEGYRDSELKGKEKS